MGKQLEGPNGLFKSRHVERERIVLCVRWVQRYAPEFDELDPLCAQRPLVLARRRNQRLEGSPLGGCES